MDSTVFREEIRNLQLRSVSHSDVLAIAKRAYSNNKVRELLSDSERSLDEYVKVLAECTPTGEVSDAEIVKFLRANRLLKEAIKQDAALIDLYQHSMKEQRALPLLAADEIATIVATAFLSGTFSQIAKLLVSRLFAKKGLAQKDLRKALDLLLSNPILPLLEEHKDGLTMHEIAKRSTMELQDVGYFLGKYEAQGWVGKVARGQTEAWRIKKTRARIIEGFLNRG
jgi:SOS response regulatory protein OraA/RecX